MTTIRDVSEAAGVSPATVSRVMNGRDSKHVGEDTRARVLEVANSLGYRPSAAARALVGGRTRTVALLSSPVVYTTWFTVVLEETQKILDEQGYHLLLVPGGKEDELRPLLRERRVDGVIWARYPVERAVELTDAITAPHQKVVGIGSIDSTAPGCCAAWWDDAAGTRQVVEHLAGLGHDRIAYLPGPESALELWPNMLRAFEEACADRGIHASVVHSDMEQPAFAGGLQMALRAVESKPRPTALFARNDDFALGVLHGLAQAGLTVPEEMSVIGYNNAPLAAYTHPSLTTVSVPTADATRSVVRALLESLDGDDADSSSPPASRQFSTRLVVRDSTGPPPV
ncbi:MAG: LacI family DNA-binding transcriptional regulator [Armatimonadia bacterium]|nr:LacI family DNA-binding transcriptional regulator [Armatimonadia bacterium]